MSDPYVTKSGIEIHKPKLFLLVGKTSKGNDTRKWQIVGKVENAKGEMVNKPTFVTAEVAAEYGGEKKATKKQMATPKARKSCKAKAKEYEEKCDEKKAAKAKSPKARKPRAKKAAAVEESEEEKSSVDESENLEEEESSSESEEASPVKKSPPKKAAKKPAAKKPVKKAPAKKPAVKKATKGKK